MKKVSLLLVGVWIETTSVLQFFSVEEILVRHLKYVVHKKYSAWCGLLITLKNCYNCLLLQNVIHKNEADR